MDKLLDCFDEMVVYKNLKETNFFAAISLPSFLRDWLLKKFEDENGNYDIDEITKFIKDFIPKKDDWVSIKDRIIIENDKVRFLTKISVDININNQEISFSLPDFGLNNKQTTIGQNVWGRVKTELVNGKDTWGVVELGYEFPDEDLKTPGKIKLTDFVNFCPYTVNLDYYKDVRSNFTTSEWIDIILGAMDYNSNGYSEEIQKLTMISRLLPFAEKRLNLIELAPKGTGKSYLFGQVSKFGWLFSGSMSRAKMFYDINKRKQGLVCNNDFVALDEIQTISFSGGDEMKAALKVYLESGMFTFGNFSGTADAGIILLGNIKQESMDVNSDMFSELPQVFHESALLDRFHGFIEGWNIPRMHDDLKISGWALNSEYFCMILHLLREDVSYRGIVDQIIKVPEKSDTRDTEAVKRLSTAFLKLIFPNVRTKYDISKEDFTKFCLYPACKMRETIIKQLGIMDIEFRNRKLPTFELNNYEK
ncbi:MAG: BREX system Lon protease-like protein BrxL [Erysipelotrichaceae bacterium]